MHPDELRCSHDIEMLAMLDLCASIETRYDGGRLHCERRGGALMLACPADSGILFNRTIGLNGADAIDEIVNAYRSLGVARAFISMDDDGSETLAQELRARGLTEARPWRKFVRDNAPPPAARCALTVRAIGPEHGEDFARIVCAAFGLAPALAPLLVRLPGRDRWSVFMSFDGATPAGAGALYVRDGIGWLGFGATDPAFRCRGSQAAVMAARINRARELGATVLTTETGEAVPGDPQHSWKNIERAGFRPAQRVRNFALIGQPR